jgi:ADP-ribose pyrophosphatase
MEMLKRKELFRNKYVGLVALGEDEYATLETPELVCVLPVLPSGEVLLIEQFRIPVEERLLELVTGGINPGENPDLAAEREVEEETGYSVKYARRVGTFYSAPGYITQKAHLYIAYLDKYVGNALEGHEVDFGLTAKKMTKEEVEKFLENNVSHPYLTIALSKM